MAGTASRAQDASVTLSCKQTHHSATEFGEHRLHFKTFFPVKVVFHREKEQGMTAVFCFNYFVCGGKFFTLRLNNFSERFVFVCFFELQPTRGR